jgi:DNA topoisomerase-1
VSTKTDTGYTLLILESPSKAKTVSKYLGPGYRVIASLGHIMDLPRKTLGISDEFELDLVPIPGKEETIKEIKLLAKGAKEVLIASDPDKEGEAIAAMIYDLIKHKNAKRVLFYEITQKAILKAIKEASGIDLLKYDSQKCRRALDRYIGYKCSPVLWDKLKGGLSAGRVQSVVLKIIVEREDKIINFVPEYWFDVLADFKKEGISFRSKYIGVSNKGSIDTTEKLRNPAEVQEIIQNVTGKSFKIVVLDKKEKIIQSQPPYTTSKLQQEASIKLKLKTKDTMLNAQKLYELGYITYMRTDSVRSEPDSLIKIRDLIKKEYGDEYVSPEVIIHKLKKTASKAQDAHEAIRPTSFELTPELARKTLNNTETQLYKLIWDKFMSSQMSSSKSEVSTVILEVDKYLFKSSGSVLIFDGFKKVSSNLDGDSDDSDALPKLAINEELIPVKTPCFTEKQSTPPPRFNEGSLVKQMEEDGIGRPSTYAAIIGNISGKMYVSLNRDDRFVPTELGNVLCSFLENYFPKQMDIKFTSKMEELLDDIEDGKISYKKVLSDFLIGLNIEIDGTKIITSIPRLGGTSSFSKKYTKEKCKICSKRMCLINGKQGDFLSCEDYPSCKGVMSIGSKTPCSECKSGKLSEGKTKAGNCFVGCTSYPECRFVSWDSRLKSCNKKPCTGKIIKTSKTGLKTCIICGKDQKN